MSYLNTFSYKYFKKSKFFSSKHKNYFHIYDTLFSKYRNKKITFVEIGVFSGGSLFMWRNFFGKKAKIIGIELNPEAKKFEKYNFKIEIGNQSSDEFWKFFFSKYGKVDIVLDDGGHTNYQQIITANNCIPKIKNNGMLVVEDVHTSYMRKKWYNPSKYSFINYSKKLVDDINSRFPGLQEYNYSLKKYIYSIQHFESITVFNINQKLCKKNQYIENNKIYLNPKEYRSKLDEKSFFNKIKKIFKFKSNFTYLVFIINAFKLSKFFK